MKLRFGDLASKAEAERLAAHEKAFRGAMRAMLVCEKIPDRDLVRRYGAEAVAEAKQRLRERAGR